MKRGALSIQQYLNPVCDGAISLQGKVNNFEIMLLGFKKPQSLYR